MAEKVNKIWYISKYAVAPKYGNPTRQYFISRYMAKKGQEVKLISSRSSKILNSPRIGFKNQIQYKSEGVDCILLNGPKIELGFNFKRLFSWIVFEFRLLYWAFFRAKEKPDVIIVSSLSLLTFLSGIILKKYFKCKLICEVRDIWPLTLVEAKKWNERNFIIRFLFYVERKGYEFADAIVGTMPNLVEHVGCINPGLISKVTWVPMGYDPEFWSKASEFEDPFKEIFAKVSDDKFIVGYAGTIGLANCIDQIIQAAELLKEAPIYFFLLGDGPLKKNLEIEVKKKNLFNVYFLPPVQKVLTTKFIEKCNILVNPIKGDKKVYKYGVSPNKWIDSMYSSKPIIISFDGYPSIINIANCGKFITPDNPEILAKNLKEFSLMNSLDLEEMGARGKKYLEENLSYEILTDKYLSIIEKS